MVYIYEPPKHILTRTRYYRDYDRTELAVEEGLFEYSVYLKGWVGWMLNDVESIIASQNWRSDEVVAHQLHINSLKTRMYNALKEFEEIYGFVALNSNATSLTIVNARETTENNIDDVETFADRMIAIYKEIYFTLNSANTYRENSQQENSE